jgi:hypothetical protein
VDQYVSEQRRIVQRPRELRRNPAGLPDRVEQLGIRAGLTQAVIRDDVRSDVEGRLDGKLERVLHEALLADVGGDQLGSRELAELTEPGFDQRQLLGDQIRVRHARTSCRRYRRRCGKRS